MSEPISDDYGYYALIRAGSVMPTSRFGRFRKRLSMWLFTISVRLYPLSSRCEGWDGAVGKDKYVDWVVRKI